MSATDAPEDKPSHQPLGLGLNDQLGLVPEREECDLPSHGWRCTRTSGHQGPCAAVPCSEDLEGVEKSLALWRGMPDKYQATTKDWCAKHPASAAHIINTLAARIDELDA